VKGRYGLALVILDGYDTITVDGASFPVSHNGFIRVFRVSRSASSSAGRRGNAA
jgi:hypothetical protein